jgi:hypothetical protein
VRAINISKQDGNLPKDSHSFLKFSSNMRFLCLKPADDGLGLIARFYGNDKNVRFENSLDAHPCTIDERQSFEDTKTGFVTYRLGQNSIHIKEREPYTIVPSEDKPLPVGSVYTGLITTPRAAAGENPGQLYLLWGANTQADLSHYKLYRSKESGFIPGDDTHIADVMPEDFVVGRYVDTNLSDHTCYYYRVCAVNQKGLCSEMSDEFCAVTKEIHEIKN